MLIEINLAPAGSSRRGSTRRAPAFSLPSLPTFGGEAKTVVGIGAGALLLFLIVFGYWRMGERRSTLTAQIEQQVADSVRYASMIALVNSLQAREDTVMQKIGIIRGVDTRRYVWPHLLDEISLSVPAYAWLTEISSTESVDSLRTGPIFTLQGSAGSTQALTRLMKNLEASAFVQDVTLITTEQESVEGRTIQRFGVQARYRVPEADFIETVPLVSPE